VHLHANDREGLAHLCGYGARPPFAQARLSELSDGRLTYRLKCPLGDGPPPLPERTPLASAPSCASTPVQSEEPATAAAEAPAPDQAPPRPRSTRIHRASPWAELLMRVFREDVLACACGGRRVVLAYLTQPGPVKAILDHLGLPSTGPSIAPACFSGGPAEATWQDDVPALRQSLR
jgi:hypothetical protein